MKDWLLPILFAANAPMYWLYWKSFFGSWDKFGQCVKFWLTPNIISMFRGQYWEDRGAEMRLVWFVIACVVTPLVEWGLIQKIFYS